ncbi:transpeptidase family protein [Candidatus Desantisbacteria bacterium]|nr:transpeptidase family protein [Candidatus Desantisbacteria bacterium]
MKKFKFRIKIIFSGIFIFFFVIFYKLIVIQVINHIEPREVHKTLEPKRGRILDRNCQELAIMIDTDSLYCVKGIPSPYKTSIKLSKILNIDFKKINKKLRSGKEFTKKKKKITYEQSKAIEKLNDPFLGFIKESKRIYPNMELASNIIGFSDIDNNGLEGIEFYYDSFLMGKSGLLTTERDARGRIITSKNRGVVPVKNGSDLVLTIDKVIQHIAEQELKRAAREYNSGGGSAIVIDPYSGEILAMANFPSYDPNEFNRYGALKRRNRAITDTFEPGSTMKIFTAIAGLEESVVKRNEIFNCKKGSLVVGGHVVHDSKEHDYLTFQGVLEKSSNIGVVRVSMRLGKQRIYDYFKKFGFGEKTGIDLLGEVRGKLTPPSNWSGTSITAIPIGQEVGVTAIQLARAIAIVANGGYKVKPILIKKIISSEGKTIKESLPEIGEKIISDATLKEMQIILESVVEEGTGGRSKTEDYTVAAKTGTAQKFVPGKGGYSSGETVLSFIGFAPTSKPRLGIVVILDCHETSGWAEGILGPVFKNIAQRSLHYLNVVPDKPIIAKKSIDEAVLASSSLEKNRKVTMAYKYPGKIMPSLTGMSIKKTLDILSNMAIDIKIIGEGVVIKQDPPPGSQIEKGGSCIIYFAKK